MKFYISSQVDSEGDVTVKISGSALVRGEAIVAKVVPPQTIEEDSSPYDVVFKIGNTTYSKAGVDNLMDVAPFIEAGRTYLPIRYVAEALGVNRDNILWDEAKGQVTINKDDLSIQLTIGSNVLKVNGKETIMDVPVKNVKSRTVLPLNFVSQALGAQVNWNDTTQTITLKVKE
ncbi:copper amine oxidase N-terminal domain-containing protein [Schinkia azotoformans]|nr:copper amine oxidase N-terminal domain-containing protein [Schinkia azotoformans]